MSRCWPKTPAVRSRAWPSPGGPARRHPEHRQPTPALAIRAAPGHRSATKPGSRQNTRCQVRKRHIDRPPLVHEQHLRFRIVELAIHINTFNDPIEDDGQVMPGVGLGRCIAKTQIGKPPMPNRAELAVTAISKLRRGGVRTTAAGPAHQTLAFPNRRIVHPGRHAETAVAGQTSGAGNEAVRTCDPEKRTALRPPARSTTGLTLPRGTHRQAILRWPRPGPAHPTGAGTRRGE